MSRLIDADALIDEMSEKHRPNFHEDVKAYHMWIMWYWKLKEAPTIDAVEVVRGKWKRKIVDDGFNADWVCSECGYRIKTDFVDYNYCPNCGAKMDGEREGE